MIEPPLDAPAQHTEAIRPGHQRLPRSWPAGAEMMEIVTGYCPHVPLKGKRGIGRPAAGRTPTARLGPMAAVPVGPVTETG
jgi:hypothetical protein